MITFCNGWGMDNNIISHIEINESIKTLNEWNIYKEFDFLKNNKKDNILIAWSMGVWASEIFFEDKFFSKKIAINGTPKGIDNKYGIPEKIFQLTLNNFNEKVKNNFLSRMGGKEIKLTRDLESQRRELQYWWDNKNINKNKINWDLAIVGNNDKIVSPQNQKKYWKENKINFLELDIEHNPFNYFKSWKEIINLAV